MSVCIWDKVVSNWIPHDWGGSALPCIAQKVLKGMGSEELKPPVALLAAFGEPKPIPDRPSQACSNVDQFTTLETKDYLVPPSDCLGVSRLKLIAGFIPSASVLDGCLPSARYWGIVGIAGNMIKNQRDKGENGALKKDSKEQRN